MTTWVFDHVHHPTGWLSPGVIEADEAGLIVRVHGDASQVAADAVRAPGFAIPGMANLHSHAFQRALVGKTEHADPLREDSFWTWRTEMYALALTLEPEDFEAVAAQAYVEMLEAGMTAVGEFHYLHHDRDGRAYATRSETSQRVLAAADATGIALTHLPVLYVRGGFDAPAREDQRRFVHKDAEDFLRLVEELRPHFQTRPLHRLGIAPHSLRAVGERDLRTAIDAVRARDAEARVHIHVAEQEKEVEEAVVHLGARPVRWLLDRIGVGPRDCLVHATHLDDAEVRDLAESAAVVGLCPTTEANLGDGLFASGRFLAAGGTFGIGSDSQVSIGVAEELRLLEYGQRLTRRRRNLHCGSEPHELHVGRFLFDRALAGGARALDQPMGAFLPGHRADVVVLDPEHPRLLGHGPQTVLDAWIFGAAEGAVQTVIVGGELVVEEGRHVRRDAVRARFAEVVRRQGAPRPARSSSSASSR